MKKWIAMLLAVMTAVPLTACAAKSGGQETASDIPDALTILNTVWASYSEDEKFPAAGGDYSEENMTDGKPGKAYLIINNSRTDTTTVALPKDAEVYQLSAETLRSQTMLCNGKALVLGEGNALPEMAPVAAKAGELTLPAATCTFIVL